MSNEPTSPNSNVLGHSTRLPQSLLDAIALVRAKLRDYQELNRLISGEETSDKQIAFAIMDAISDFNTTPPLIGSYSIDNFPSLHLLINGAIINILTSVGLLQTRNHLVYSDGQGIQVGVSDKAPQLMNWIVMFKNEHERKLIRLKQAINLSTALNGSHVPSEYALINGYFDEL